MRRVAFTIIGFLIFAIIFVFDFSWGADQVVAPTQGHNTFNQEVTSAVATAVSVTIAGILNQQVRLHSFAARCSAGTANVTVSEVPIGGSAQQEWSSSVSLIGTVTTTAAWTPAPFTTRFGNGLMVTLGSCGGSNTGTLDVQGEQY